MDFSLWRGDRALGRIDLRESPMDGQLSGVLVPAQDAHALQSLMQVILPTMPGGAAFQFPIEPDGVERTSPRTLPSRPSTVDLKPLSTREAQGVPPELRLRICDEGGVEQPTRLIMLRETRLSADATISMWGVAAELEDPRAG